MWLSLRPLQVSQMSTGWRPTRTWGSSSTPCRCLQWSTRRSPSKTTVWHLRQNHTQFGALRTDAVYIQHFFRPLCSFDAADHQTCRIFGNVALSSAAAGVRTGENLTSRSPEHPWHNALPPTVTGHLVDRQWRSSLTWTGPQRWWAASVPSWCAAMGVAAASREPTCCTAFRRSWAWLRSKTRGTHSGDIWPLSCFDSMTLWLFWAGCLSRVWQYDSEGALRRPQQSRSLWEGLRRLHHKPFGQHQGFPSQMRRRPVTHHRLWAVWWAAGVARCLSRRMEEIKASVDHTVLRRKLASKQANRKTKDRVRAVRKAGLWLVPSLFRSIYLFIYYGSSLVTA